MKRILSLWLGFLALALMPAVAQSNMGTIHGLVTNPTGAPQSGGTVGLSTDGGASQKYTFPVDANGNYKGEAPAGNYMVIYSAADQPGKIVDSFKGIRLTAGQDTDQDIDMSRPDFINKLSAEQRKQLEDLKKSNQAAMSDNKIVKQLNTDLGKANQDTMDANGANQAAKQQLGASASAADVAAKADEIAKAAYTDIVTMMQKDVTLRPTEALLWMDMGRAENGLKEYDDAISTFKKALDLESTSKKPRPEVVGDCNAGLGEAYAREGKVPEATAAIQAAVTANPPQAGMYLRNEAVIFFQEHNGPAQVTAADAGIAVAPNDALLYYIKGQGLVGNATVDPKTQQIVLPPDCVTAYEKYLELAPTGPYAAEVAGILSASGQKVPSSYKAPKH